MDYRKMEPEELETVRQKYKILVQKLIEENLSVTTMESITGGLIASLITDNEGSSKVFKGGFVTYSNEAKIANGVSPQIIEKFGVYSHETAREMALAASRAVDSDFAIGVTGTASNLDPANKDSVPGEIYISIYLKKESSQGDNVRSDYASMICKNLEKNMEECEKRDRIKSTDAGVFISKKMTITEPFQRHEIKTVIACEVAEIILAALD